MTPYYEQDGVTIYHGNCEEIVYRLDCEEFDLLLTDPPYGIGYAANPISTGGHEAKAWDDSQMSYWFLMFLIARARYQVIWGGNYFRLPLSRCWLIWHKPDAAPSMGDVEMAWTNLDKPSQHMTHSIAATNGERVGHPTQKPEPLIRWAIMQAPADCGLIIDPFMGSGTTLVAAKRLGRKAIGIELEEKYCEIAAKRLQQGALPLEMGA